MYVIIRDPETKQDTRIDSLSGFVRAEPVERSSLSQGLPQSEAEVVARPTFAQISAEKLGRSESAESQGLGLRPFGRRS